MGSRFHEFNFMYLLISTEDNSKFAVAIGEKSIDKFKIVEKPYSQSELLLKTIASLVEPSSQLLGPSTQLKAVFVVTGPGGFSATRIGVSTANALGDALKIPVVGVKLTDAMKAKEGQVRLERIFGAGLKGLAKKKVGDYAKPFYDKEPNITKKGA